MKVEKSVTDERLPMRIAPGSGQGGEIERCDRPVFVGRVSDADFSRDALQGGEAERDGPVGRCVPGGYQHAAVYPLQARQDEFTRATRGIV